MVFINTYRIFRLIKLRRTHLNENLFNYIFKAPSEESSRPDITTSTVDSSEDNTTRTDNNTGDSNIDMENPDADDQDIVNESESESSEEEQ